MAKINSKQTVLSVYKTLSNKKGNPHYAFATPYEEGPEFGLQEGEGTIYNKPVGVWLNKVFNLDITAMCENGEAMLDSMLVFILERVGRNRTYTRDSVRTYLRKASNVYAAMRAAQGSIKAITEIPGFALRSEAGAARAWKEFYEDVVGVVNVKYPLPTTIANFIDEYIVPYLVDTKGAFEKPFSIAVKALEVYDGEDDAATIEFDFSRVDTTALRGYINRPLNNAESSFARDVETCLETKKLPADAMAAPSYPLDTKHRCDLINATKGTSFTINDTLGIMAAANCTFNIRSVWITNGTFAAVSHKDNVEARSVTLAPTYNDVLTQPGENRIESPVAIDSIQFITMTGEDDEEFPGSLIVDAVNLYEQLDELMIAINYAELFGGVGFHLNGNSNPRCIQIDPFYTYAFPITQRNMSQIRSAACGEIFDFVLLTDKPKEDKPKKQEGDK